MDNQTKNCIEAQWDYVIRHHAMFFIPDDGICFFCKKNIFHPDGCYEGISLKKASNELITGCPHCFRTYCD